MVWESVWGRVVSQVDSPGLDRILSQQSRGLSRRVVPSLSFGEQGCSNGYYAYVLLLLHSIELKCGKWRGLDMFTFKMEVEKR